MGETRLSGQVAVVTGAGQGIGAAIARLLGEHGARVAVNDLNGDAAEGTAACIRAAGGEALAILADVSSASAVAAMVETVTREFGPPTILVNNAAYMTMAPLADLDEDQWDRVLDTDLKGPYLMTRAALAGMIAAGGGRIVNMSSEWGIVGEPGAAHYSAAKAGLIGLTKALARELAPHGILVNAVAPSVVDTPQLEVDAAYAGVPLDVIKERYASAVPLGRIARPDEIARTVLMLVLETGDFYTGQVFRPNGGTS